MSFTYPQGLAIVTGWGRLAENGAIPNVLQKVTLPLINKYKCRRWFSISGYGNHKPGECQLCSGTEQGGTDSCQVRNTFYLFLFCFFLFGWLLGVSRVLWRLQPHSLPLSSPFFYLLTSSTIFRNTPAQAFNLWALTKAFCFKPLLLSTLYFGRYSISVHKSCGELFTPIFPTISGLSNLQTVAYTLVF